MTPDEVRLLDNSKCILFIRGERPALDLKYNLLKHPNIRYTEDAAQPLTTTPPPTTRGTICPAHPKITNCWIWTIFCPENRLKSAQPYKEFGGLYEAES